MMNDAIDYCLFNDCDYLIYHSEVALFLGSIGKIKRSVGEEAFLACLDALKSAAETVSE